MAQRPQEREQIATRPATIFAIEAARNLCTGDDELALELLRMAVDELERQL